MTALLHDVGKARVPVDILNKTTGLDERGVADHAGASLARRAHAVRHALARRAAVPRDPRGARAPHEDRPDRLSQVRPRRVARHLLAIVAVADGFDAATTRRSYQTVPIEPDQVLREMWENPKRGYDPVLVKALINLIGIYPVGTCVILDTFEIGLVAAPNPEGQQLNRPLVRIAVDADGGSVPPPGTLVSLTEQDETGALPALDRQGHQSRALRPHGRRLLCLSPGSRRPGPPSAPRSGPR